MQQQQQQSITKENNSIFNIGSTSSYNYLNQLTSTPSALSKTNGQQPNFATNYGGGGSSNSTTGSSTIGNSSGSNGVANQAQQQQQNAYVEIQAQFELSIELRKFINIDLFQRGYYQIRLAIKCGNKQIPVKIIVQLENNQNNNNLSGELHNPIYL
jgi:hypothetical protein